MEMRGVERYMVKGEGIVRGENRLIKEGMGTMRNKKAKRKIMNS